MEIRVDGRGGIERGPFYGRQRTRVSRGMNVKVSDDGVRRRE